MFPILDTPEPLLISANDSKDTEVGDREISQTCLRGASGPHGAGQGCRPPNFTTTSMNSAVAVLDSEFLEGEPSEGVT